VSKYDGTTWNQISLGGGLFSAERISKDIGGGVDTLYVAGAVNTKAALYNSIDGGNTYNNQDSSTTSNTRFYGTVIDPINFNRVYLFGLYNDNGQRNWDLSNNGGFSWTHNRSPISGTYTIVQDMVVDPSNQFSGISQNILAAMYNKGIYRSENGAEGPWSQVFFNSNADVRSLALNTNNPTFVYAATNFGVWKSSNHGVLNSWYQMRTGGYKRVVMCPGVGSDNTYIATITEDGSKVYYSPDAGVTWFDVTGNLATSTPINNLFGIGSIIGTMYVATDNGIYKISEPSAPPILNPPSSCNFDVTLSWSTVTNATSYHLQIAYDVNFTNLLIDAKGIASNFYSPTNLIITKTYYWRVAANNIAGETNFSTGQPFTISASLVNVLTCGKNSNCNPVLRWTAFDASSSSAYKIYRYSCKHSSSGGGTQSFSNVEASSIVPGPTCNCGGGINNCKNDSIDILPLIATTTNTTYTDYEVTINNSTSNTEYWYEVRRANYTNKVNVLSYPISKSAVRNDIDEDIPKFTTLRMNFPNPFNPITTIKYDLSEDVHVTIKIYDILGREVMTLVDGFQEAGYKSVTLDASTLPSGVYFYRMTAGRYTDIKKMILLK